MSRVGAASVRFGSALAFLLAWQLVAMVAGSRLLPSAAAVLGAIGREAASGALPLSLGITLARVAGAFGLAMLAGVALGLAMGRWRTADLLLDSWVTVLLNLPALVLIVLIYVWFGLSDAALVVAVALNKLPSTAVTVREGMRALDRGLLDMAESFRMPRLRVLRHVVLPQLAPYLFAAARTGLALIWKIVLVAELLGRSNGVGFEIQIAFQLFDVKRILAYTLAFIAVAQGIEWGVMQPLERHVLRWRG